MDEQQMEMERSISEAMNDEPHPKVKIECRKRVFLFNCDKTSSLDSVGKLLLDMKGDIRQELSFDIVKTYFRLSEMSHVAEKTIPKLQMDVAFFVVHANESRLSINEENAGIGYAKVYTALLQATGGKVIIVIGGDNYYKNKDEEESSMISRWASRKVSSQFENEFLDGRKSFIFSWNKTHRKIHEEALLHYFDPGKKGRKFEWKPNEGLGEPQKTLLKTLETEKAKAKECEQFADHPHAIDEAHSSSEKDVSKQQKSLSEVMCNDKGFELKEERKKHMECEDLEENRNGLSEGCTGESGSRKTTEAKDVLTSQLRAMGTISKDDYVFINEEDLDGYSEEQQMNGKTRHGTLVMKTVVRNGSISCEEDEYALNPQWEPPGGFLVHISEQLEHVAEVEVEIYQKEETGALCVVMREISVIYAIIEYFWNITSGLFDRVYNFNL